jgi:hypothetical protein
MKSNRGKTPAPQAKNKGKDRDIRQRQNINTRIERLLQKLIL